MKFIVENLCITDPRIVTETFTYNENAGQRQGEQLEIRVIELNTLEELRELILAHLPSVTIGVDFDPSETIEPPYPWLYMIDAYP